MHLSPGARLGPYEIVSTLGAGGMGEVYRARDTRLKRDVAIKVLLEVFAQDSDRLARFQREAEVLATLNHPNIAIIYGLEIADGIHALVLELVEGPTLADRIAQGPLPVDEALPIARQITEALAAAHEQGIVHRDLKPANIKLRPDGTVKVLDFGLAKIVEAGEAGKNNLTQSPTITTPAMTQAGVILGTAAYMSPEQAKGRPADRRSDVWAFGCVLYEMLTGQRAFAAEDVSETLAAVLRGEPDWSALSNDVPASVVALLKRCLVKDSKRRVADISTALFVIDESANAGASIVAPVNAVRRPLWTRAIPIAATGLLVVTAAVVWNMRPSQPVMGLTRFPILLPEGERLTNEGSHVIAISPDGANVAYAANQQLYVRNVAEMEARPIQGTAQAREAFFSPDGRWLGFYAAAERKLKKIAITGGASVTICDADNLFGASWAPDDRIFFGQAAKGILRVSAYGGTPETVVAKTSGGFAHGPQILPGGAALLFTLSASRSVSGWDSAQIVLQSLKSGETRVLIERGSDARYVPTGHIVYAVGSTLFAVPFDAKTLQVTGGPVSVVEGASRAPTGTTGAVQFSFSNNGSMAYVPEGAAENAGGTLALIDRAGSRTLLKTPPGSGSPGQPRIAPNGKQLAFFTDDGKERIVWISDLTGAGPIRRLTFGGNNDRPTWTPDSQRVVFHSDREGDEGLFWQRADVSGSAERLARAELGTVLQPESWLPDGNALIFSVGRGGDRSLWMRGLGAEQKPKRLIAGYASNSSLSADGRWLAYSWIDTGRREIYVQPFPLTEAKYQVPTSGRDPLWSPDGHQLFYLQDKGNGWQVVSVNVQTEPGFAFGNPTPLPIEGIVGFSARAYDITPDGKAFVVILPKSQTDPEHKPQPDQINMTLNWFEELKQRVATK